MFHDRNQQNSFIQARNNDMIRAFNIYIDLLRISDLISLKYVICSFQEPWQLFSFRFIHIQQTIFKFFKIIFGVIILFVHAFTYCSNQNYCSFVCNGWIQIKIIESVQANSIVGKHFFHEDNFRCVKVQQDISWHYGSENKRVV